MGKYLITINGASVICSENQRKFVEMYVEEYCHLSIVERNITIVRAINEDLELYQTYYSLNHPTGYLTELDLPIACYFGEYITNNEADRRSLLDFGVYFSTICWVDGCEDAFRTSIEEEQAII